MANISLQQTDSAAVDGSMAACSGAAPTPFYDSRTATRGGSPGVTTPQITVGMSQSNARGIHFESASGEPGQKTWPARNWVVRLNVTTPNANVSWTGCYVCRVSVMGVSLATVASLTGQNVGLGVAGVVTMTLAGSLQVANADDRIYIVLVFSNSQPTVQSFNYQPNQLIDTPLVVQPAVLFSKPVVLQESLLGTALVSERLASLRGKGKETSLSIQPSLSGTVAIVEKTP